MTYWRVPLDIEQVEIPQGELHIHIERCKGCGFCEEYCPLQVLKMSSDYNRKGYHYPQVVRPETCVNCNLCEMICPDFAIFCLAGEPRHPAPALVLTGGNRNES